MESNRMVLGVLSVVLMTGIGFAVSDPLPTDGGKGVQLPVTLQFAPAEPVEDAVGYVIFIGTNPREVDIAFYRNHPNVQVHETQSTSLTVLDLQKETTYFWRVDFVDDQVESLRKGPVWSFTTRASDVALTFFDDFNDSRDYLADGVGDTGWDGFIGHGPGQTAERIMAANGVLTLQSARGRYEAGSRPLGPLLYKTITTDFKATVRVEDYQRIGYNNGGIMARAVSSDEAGQGENWISIDYFPLYAGIYARMADGTQRHEVCGNDQGENADRFLQMEKAGSLFFLRHSPDGQNWTELPCSPITRSDLVNVPLQVGLFQCTYSDNQGRIAYDDFTLNIGGHIKTARVQSPADGAVNTPLETTLSWIPGHGASHHDIYLSDSKEAVEQAHCEMAPGDGVYRGRQAVDAFTYTVSDLEGGTSYYWRIDEVSGDEIVRGRIWHFATVNRVLENFGKFSSTDGLTAQWRASGTAAVSLTSSESRTGQNAMRLDYNNVMSPHYAAIEYTFAENRDWMCSELGFRWLTVYFKGHPDNRADNLSMIFEDNDWIASRTVVPYDGDAANLRRSAWTRWDIDLQDLAANNPAFRLHSVKKMGVVIGDPKNSTPGSRGRLWIDSIVLNIQRYDETGQVKPSAPRYIQPDRFVKAVPFTSVSIADGLWHERKDVSRNVSLPHVWGKCEYFKTAAGEDSKRIDNFRKAAGLIPGGFTGTFFNDSDVYKIIEGTAYCLQNDPDLELEAYTDEVIDAIAGAQWDDGYLFTHYSLPRRPEARWTNIGHMHELYCAGHLIEGAIAYYEATGKRKLLNVAERFVEHIEDTFGPDKNTYPPGHQEIELALMRLYHLTGQQRYMDLAKYFVDQRGRGEGRNFYGTYSQDHVPFIQQEKGVGHSVRAGYMYIAATDIAMVNHDEAYANALFRLWDNITNTKTYLTGGIGQPGGPEGFAGDYQLGNNCYSETCSGIAFIMWNHRLHLMTGESRYLDNVERTLYNNVLSSLSQCGKEHYYTNPLSHDGHRRWEWPGHDCACCPSNLVRVFASLGGYLYTHRDDAINVNLYMANEATISLGDNPVKLTQTTRYPWDGNIRIAVQPQKNDDFAIRLRIPGWAQNRPMPGNLYRYLDTSSESIALSVNGDSVPATIEHGYITLKRTWRDGDTIEMRLPMPIRRVIAHPKATANTGLVAVERGPIVYCAEAEDNDFGVSGLKLLDRTRLSAQFEEDFFNGVMTITADGESTLKLIPNYLHSNRGRGWMRVWIPRQ